MLIVTIIIMIIDAIIIIIIIIILATNKLFIRYLKLYVGCPQSCATGMYLAAAYRLLKSYSSANDC